MPPSHRLIGSLPRINSLSRGYRNPSLLITRSYRTNSFLLRQHSPQQYDVPVTGDRRNYEKARSLETDAPMDTISNLNVYGDIPAPASAIETIYENGFLFSSGVSLTDGSGVLLVHNEAFKWRPTKLGSDIEAKAITTGVLELGKEVWGLLDVVHPKPGIFSFDQQGVVDTNCS
jgi:NADH dehydrogenase [ubiquinone] 1 alpha subcomplex assembly factor 3